MLLFAARFRGARPAQVCLHCATFGVMSPACPQLRWLHHCLAQAMCSQPGCTTRALGPPMSAPGTLACLSWPGHSPCNWPAFVDRPKATKQHPASVLNCNKHNTNNTSSTVINCTGYSASVGSDLISRLHHTTEELEQLEDGTSWGVILP